MITYDGGTETLEDGNGNELLRLIATSGAVNYLTLANQAAGSAPEIGVAGDDTDISLVLAPKGAGAVVISLLAALSEGYSNITGTKSDTDYTVQLAEYLARTLRFGWTGWTGAHNAILPLTAGMRRSIVNATGYAVTVKGLTGSGITIANGKTAVVWCDGTNWQRETADT